MSEENVSDETVSPKYCKASELNLLPKLLSGGYQPKRSPAIRFSNVSFEDHDSTNETKHVNNISSRCSYDSECFSYSTNERFELINFISKLVITLLACTMLGQ